jgi:hypothetical protein
VRLVGRARRSLRTRASVRRAHTDARSGRRAGAQVETPRVPTKPGTPRWVTRRRSGSPRKARRRASSGWAGGCCHGRDARRGAGPSQRGTLPKKLPRSGVAVRHRARDRRKAPLCRAFRCAEEDSNLHPVIPDQALNLVTRLSYPSQSRQIVRSVRESGRCGRIGRFGCCHGCCHDLHISLVERPSGRSPTRPNNVGCVCRAYPVVGRRVRRSRDARRT